MRAHDQAAARAFPGPDFYEVLRWIHAALNPAVYVEVGVLNGCSLAASQPHTLSIGIDPSPQPQSGPPGCRIFPLTSNEFFAAYDLREFTSGQDVDFALVDGLHLFEQTVEDFCNLERFMSPRGVIAIHDTIPLDRQTSSRIRTTEFYTGDVWKVVPWLRQCRPELAVATVAAGPSGLTLIRELNPQFDHSPVRGQTEPFAELEFDYFERHRDAFLETIPNQRAAVAAFCQNTPVQSTDSSGSVMPAR